MEARRLTLPQVSLYLGAWILAVGAALLTFFPLPGLAGAPAVLVAWAAAAPTAWIGVRNWRRGYLSGRHRATCWRYACWLPVAVLVTLEEARLVHRLSRTGNVSAGAVPPPGTSRRRRPTRNYGGPSGGTAGLLVAAPLHARAGLLPDVRGHGRAAVPGHAASPGHARLAGPRPRPILLRICSPAPRSSWRPDSPSSAFAVPTIRATSTRSPWSSPGRALSGVATFHRAVGRLAEGRLRPGPADRSNTCSSSMPRSIRAATASASGCPRLRCAWWASAFRFVIPGHVMTSLLLLGLNAQIARIEERALRMAAAGCRVYVRIRQHSAADEELLCFAAWCSSPSASYRLQQDVFRERAAWPDLPAGVGTGDDAGCRQLRPSESSAETLEIAIRLQ